MTQQILPGTAIHDEIAAPVGARVFFGIGGDYNRWYKSGEASTAVGYKWAAVDFPEPPLDPMMAMTLAIVWQPSREDLQHHRLRRNGPAGSDGAMSSLSRIARQKGFRHSNVDWDPTLPLRLAGCWAGSGRFCSPSANRWMRRVLDSMMLRLHGSVASWHHSIVAALHSRCRSAMV